MASHAKNAQKFARLLFKLSVVDGAVSADRVAGAIEYVEKHNIANPVMVLKAYHRLVETELAKSLAVVEHAGAIQEATLAAIASAMTRKYGRSVTATSKPNPGLLAGLRVQVGDDIYESSVRGQLATLASSV